MCHNSEFSFGYCKNKFWSDGNLKEFIKQFHAKTAKNAMIAKTFYHCIVKKTGIIVA